MQVIAFAFEERMLLHVKHDIQITRGTTELTDLPPAAKADASPVFNSGRNLRVDSTLAKQSALAFALRARISDDVAGSLARGTRARDAEESLLVANLPAAIAGAAGRRPFAGSSSRPATFFTSFVAANSDLRFGAEVCFLELKRQVFAQISAALHTTAAASPAPKHVAETEKFPENVAEVLENTRIKTGAAARSAAQSGMPEAIVHCALVRVSENRIRFADFFELFFGVGIVGIPIRMVLQSQLAVSRLEFHFCDRTGHSQDLVIIAFRVRRQISSFLRLLKP